jgi:DNA-binding CsgD family transcriptional regulator
MERVDHRTEEIVAHHTSKVQTKMRLAYAALFTSGTKRTIQDDFNLTKREVDVAWLVMKGMSNTEVADLLRIRLGTVQAYLWHACAKMGVHNRQLLTLKMALASGTIRGIEVEEKFHEP